MRIAQINNCSNGSTGMIMHGIHQELLAEGEESLMCWSRGRDAQELMELRFGSKVDVYLHGVGARLFDGVGCFSKRTTKGLVKKLDEFNPDVIHLHNIHGYCLNMDVLFDYLACADRPVVWTLHSCWAFTGHCSYFSYVGCDRWKTGCHDCRQVREFPKSILLDRSSRNYVERRRLFNLVADMTIATPSVWLGELVGESFLSGYPRAVIRNGIDTSTFNTGIDGRPARERLGIGDERFLLAVASPWSPRKGLADMVGLRELLGDEYAIVVVGLSREQLGSIPQGIIGLARTDSAQELAELYAAADLFVNPTHEENYPTVNLEALACGTPVVTYDTGGSPECTFDRHDCIVAGDKTPESMAEVVRGFFASGAHRATSAVASKRDCSEEYIKLYRKILERR